MTAMASNHETQWSQRYCLFCCILPVKLWSRECRWVHTTAVQAKKLCIAERWSHSTHQGIPDMSQLCMLWCLIMYFQLRDILVCSGFPYLVSLDLCLYVRWVYGNIEFSIRSVFWRRLHRFIARQSSLGNSCHWGWSYFACGHLGCLTKCTWILMWW